jgi:hypothetical protein
MQNGSDLRGIIYTNGGTIKIQNNAVLKEVVGYRLEVENDADVVYESGLANVNFSAGPSGGWIVTSWKEIP